MVSDSTVIAIDHGNMLTNFDTGCCSSGTNSTFTGCCVHCDNSSSSQSCQKNVAAAQWREQRRLLCSALLRSRRGESSSWCSCLGVKVRLLGVPSDLLSWAAASVDATTGILASSPRTRPWPPVLVMGPWTTTSRLSLPAPWPWVRPSGMETFISFLGRADFCTISPATALGKGKALAINILGMDDCSVILASSPSTGEATGLLHATH